MAGRTALRIALGLRQADYVVLSVAPVFFGAVMDRFLEVAQLHAARLYDRTGDSVTVHTLLTEASKHPKDFPRGDVQSVCKAVAKAHTQIALLAIPLKFIKTRRNEGIAHLDPRSVVSPGSLKQTAPITFAELEKIFDVTAAILLDFWKLLDGTCAPLVYLSDDDYTVVLGHIEKELCARADDYEKTNGEAPPWPVPAKYVSRNRQTGST